ncbi:PREDICTED: U3 small nucleolar RNA-associated protein 14-like isoform X2 [Ipomoea nil]|uniref:U3 small nucleolar RNA-associated protein 14-like isoform X2 n=1 Tax=Ipomoea nil TaxID=35883 RepID=UPI0009009ADA|nr:PREDICTED: U3 small nucleolar RNA-associated protein 14-like isoform X2 [Ipomoea nil]
MDNPILSLPPAEPPPENPPEKAPPKPHTYNDSAMLNFRALMMKMAVESSPSKSLTPAQTLILEDKLRQCFPYLRAPDHPPYAWMITTAIKQLKEEGGSSEEAISECIMNDNNDLPWAHSTLLKHHLVKLCEKREIVQTRDGLYVLNDRFPSVPRAPSPSKPSKFFDSTASPSCSLSISLASDSSSDSLYGGSSRRRRKSKKVRNKRKKGKSIHLKRKRKVKRRPFKKGKWKEEISSDEEMEVELHDIVLEEEGMDAIKPENRLNWQKVIVEEELHRSEDINEDGNQLEMNAEMELQEGTVVIEEEEQITGNPAQKEQEVMEESHQSLETLKEDKQEDMEEKKMDWACEKDVQDLLLPEISDVDEENPLQLTETNDELENTNLVNDTKFQEMVDEGLEEHGCQEWKGKEIIHSPKNSSFLDQNTEEINVLETTNEHEETIDIKLNDQQEQETVACEDQSNEKAKMGMVDDPYIECSSDEVEEISSPFQQNNEVSSEEEEQQELQDSEDTTKQEQVSQKQLRSRVIKAEPGTQEHRIPQVVLSLQAITPPRRVTRRTATTTAGCISPLLDEQAPQQRKKRVKSQVGEISRMPRRSTRLSSGQSRKRVSRSRT